MKRRTIAVFILTGLVASVASAANYYVSAAGNDSNSGTSNSPWRHCPGMTGWSGSATLAAGATVYFKNTDMWTASTGGRLIRITGGVTYDGETWGGGSNAVFRATYRFVDGVIVEWLQDHATYPTIFKGFEVDGGGYGVSGITINGPSPSSTLTGAVKRIENCIVHHCGFSNESTYGWTDYGINVGARGGTVTRNVEVLRCKVYNTGRTAIAIYPSNDSPYGQVDTVLVRNCEAHNAGLDPTASGFGIMLKNNVTNAIVEFNYIYDSKNGFGIDCEAGNKLAPRNCTIRYNVVRGTEGPGLYDQSAADEPRSYDLYGNIFFKNKNCGYTLDTPTSNLTARIYNNTFFENCTGVGSQEIYIGTRSSMPAIEFKNNLISAASGIQALRDVSANTITHSHNLLYRPNGGTLVQNGGSSYSSNNLTVWEPTALAVNPGFKNSNDLPDGFSGVYGLNLLPNRDGLSILPSQSAIDKGQTLATKFSGAINLSGKSGTDARQAPWDIGAYELGGGESQIPAPPSRPRVVPDI